MPAQMGRGRGFPDCGDCGRQVLPGIPSGEDLLPSVGSALSSVQLPPLSVLPQRQGVALPEVPPFPGQPASSD